jgi:transcriptional regulator with XRE-family HTH domain
MTTEIIPNADEVGVRIRMARSLLPLNRKEFCEKHGLNVYTIQAWEIGRNQVGATSLRRFCEALEKEGVFCTTEWIMYGKGGSPYKMGSHGLAINAERKWVEPTTENVDETALIDAEANFFRMTQQDAGHSAEVIEIADNAMQPLFAKGDRVGGRRVPLNAISRLDGQVALIETSSGNFVVRRLILEGQWHLLIPSDLNARTAVLDKIESVYEIVWHRKVPMWRATQDLVV